MWTANWDLVPMLVPMLADFYIRARLFLLVNCITDAYPSTSVSRSPAAHGFLYNKVPSRSRFPARHHPATEIKPPAC